MGKKKKKTTTTNNPKRLIIAIPVAPKETSNLLNNEADHVEVIKVLLLLILNRRTILSKL